MTVIETLALDVGGRRIAALRRPPAPDASGREAPRLLCLHGWLDNAASFLPLATQLPPALDVVALDLPGHGESEWLEGGYPLAEMAWRAHGAARALGWARHHLLGHSLGGSIAPLVAVGAPQTVASLVLVESAGALAEPAAGLPSRLARHFAERDDLARFASREFSDVEAAVASRLRAARMRTQSARLVVGRQLRAAAGGWRWRFDPMLRVASPGYQTEDQVRAVLGALRCPTLAVVATEGFLAARAETAEARLGCLGTLRRVTLPGNHHLHMDTPAPVARVIADFLVDSP